MRQIAKSEVCTNLILTLWGLLFTKCFLLEYLVRHYGVPINSLAYVWTLSVLMATVATAVHVGLHTQERETLANKPGFIIASLTWTVASLFVLKSLAVSAGQAEMALASAPLILAVRHFWLAARGTAKRRRWRAPAWLASAIAIAYFGTPTGFLIFAISITCLTVLPGLTQFLAQRQVRVRKRADT